MDDYTKPGRLADVITLIQALGEPPIGIGQFKNDELIKSYTKPGSADSWVIIAIEHRELFTFNNDEISLISRRLSETKGPLDPTHINKLIEIAIMLHDSQLENKRGWKYWFPALAALLGAIIGSLIGSPLFEYLLKIIAVHFGFKK